MTMVDVTQENKEEENNSSREEALIKGEYKGTEKPRMRLKLMGKRFEGENQRQNQFDISICPGMILLIPVDASLFISGIMGEDKQ